MNSPPVTNVEHDNSAAPEEISPPSTDVERNISSDVAHLKDLAAGVEGMRVWQQFPQTLESAVQCWHDGSGPGLQLHEYLGLTWDEYKTLSGSEKWAERSDRPAHLVRTPTSDELLEQLCDVFAELAENWRAATASTLVMVRTEDGTMHTVKGVEVERHDPADSVGGTTIWLSVEEY